MPDSRLPFDPIDRAGDLWEEHFGDATAMRLATSVMRVQQLMIGALDAALKPFGLTFSRYEVLVLLLFSQHGSLPLSKIGARLMVHPTSVTNTIDRLEAAGLVRREPNPQDGRGTLAVLTDEGRAVATKATADLNAARFGLGALSGSELTDVYRVLRRLRHDAGDYL